MKSMLLQVLVCVLALTVEVVAEDLVTLKSGRSLRGKIVAQNATKVVVKTIGGTFTLARDTIDSIQSDGAGPAGGAAKSDDQASAESTKVYFIPISGALEFEKMPYYVQKGLDSNNGRGAKVVVFKIDSPGGLCAVGLEIAKVIDALEGRKTVAWVNGKEREALSAAVLPCLACDQIVMHPKAKIGGATPYLASMDGRLAPVKEKFLSIFRAQFRDMAQRHGHPALLVEAMVDNSLVVYAKGATGEKAFSSAAGGELVSPAGKLVTLTAREAMDLGLAVGVAADREQLYRLLDVDKPRTAESPYAGDHAAKKAAEAVRRAKIKLKKAQKYLDKLNSRFARAASVAEAADPRRHTYVVNIWSRKFGDGGIKWRKQSDNCVTACKYCLKKCKDLRRLAKRTPELRLDESKIKDLEAAVARLGNRVLQERATTVLPR